ncbi:hypothetical protein [Deinococcus altitudinis]|uniref:hypothetical protein n=1 Tax=Deinococcus altitudinis TaxID=468914 RepID=UPI0038925768
MNDDGQALKMIEEFVLSLTQPGEFEHLLLVSPALEDFLRREPPLPPYSTSPAHNFYQFLLETKYSSPRSVMKARDGLSLLLKRHDVFVRPVNGSADKLALLESVQPKWLDLTERYAQTLAAEAGTRQGSELRSWFKAEIGKRFRFVARAPKWVQSPCWPVRDGVPLVFLGQVATGELLHDHAQVYVFMHPDSLETETVVQSA